MNILLKNAGKKFNRDWIFRNMNYEFSAGTHYAILGPNGSGKSTLLQLLSGFILPSEGGISYSNGNGNEIKGEDFFRYIGFSSPYLELLEEFNLEEMVQFHLGFKKFIGGITAPEFIGHIGMKNSAGKEIKYYSTGMKQRLRLALAVLSDVPVVFLDEPLTNLDQGGIDWYNGLIEKYSEGRLFLVCSNNQPAEFSFCKEKIDITAYKK